MLGSDLATIWAFLIATAVFLYAALDGFDLGVGILFPFAKDSHERDQMQAAIAPVWDGNETWLVLGGGGLFAAFPKAYGALMPAFYLPIFLMLLALIFRGVAFEFRHHGRKSGKKWWTVAFAGGSIVAAAAQGMVLGAFIQGVNVVDGEFVGGPLDWLTPFTLLTSAALVAGYALLGAAWLVYKTQGELFERARAWVKQLAILVALAMGAVSLGTLGVDPRVTYRWGLTMTSIDWGTFIYVAPLPIAAGLAVLHALAGRRTTTTPATLPVLRTPLPRRLYRPRHQPVAVHRSFHDDASRSRRCRQCARPPAVGRDPDVADHPRLYRLCVLALPPQGVR